MTDTRRSFLLKAAALPLAGLAPGLARAEIDLGGATLSTVSDGSLVLPGSFVFGPMPQDELAGILARHGQPADRLTPECNLALLRDGANTVLFDAGAGPDFMPTAGRLADSLDALGLAPEEVTHVVFTHAHPDHIWGILDDFDEPAFPEAAFLMGRGEWDYWRDPDTVETIGEARASFAVGARRRMEAIEDRMAFFGDGDEILEGVAAVASHGHTPGHMSFEVRRGSESAMILGDAVGNHHVAFARPEWESGSDQDPAAAAAARARLLDRVAGERMRVVGFHLPNGGIGRVARDGAGYRFEQDA